MNGQDSRPTLKLGGKIVGKLNPHHCNIDTHNEYLRVRDELEREALRPLPEAEPENLPMGLWATIKYKLGKFWDSLSF